MKLSYRDEKDKCYGATGMAMGMVIFDGENMLSSVSLDADPGEMIEYVAEYYFSGNPSVSAKAAWNRILSNYNLTMGMSLANVLCRRLVLDNERTLADETVGELQRLMLDEGRRSCSLDDDEISRLFNKNYSYLHRVFSHRGVQNVAHEFADTLMRSRRLTRNEVIEQLRALSML